MLRTQSADAKENTWWQRLDSNQRPSAYEAPALPLSYVAAPGWDLVARPRGAYPGMIVTPLLPSQRDRGPLKRSRGHLQLDALSRLRRASRG